MDDLENFSDLKNEDKKESTPQKSQIQYQKLTDFIKRINQLDIDKTDTDVLQSPSTRQNLVPMLPESTEKCSIEMPNGDKHDIDMYEPTIGPKALNGPQVFQKTGLFTYDPGFTSTASCVSAITYIDGEKG